MLAVYIEYLEFSEFFGVFRGLFGIFSVILRFSLFKFLIAMFYLQKCLNSLLIDVLEDALREAVVSEVAD